MAKDWEAPFSEWTGQAEDAERRRYEWTRDQIDEALRGTSGPLRNHTFKVYAKGSYPNFTNVVKDSDVDVAVELTTFIQNDFIHDASAMTLDSIPGATPYSGGYTLAQFKDDVEAALTAQFGAAAVDRGKKAIHIRESQRGLAADVVPCNTHRTYVSPTTYREGIELRNDARPLQDIVNYPKQHLERGKDKNSETHRRYKSVVRILKHLENEMVAKNVIEVVPSFLIESAIWNAPNTAFNWPDSWSGRVREVLGHIYNGTRSNDCVQSDDWLEANGIKYLFHSDQSWTYEQANDFTVRAWNYLGWD
jgi:hypothetical protein